MTSLIRKDGAVTESGLAGDTISPLGVDFAVRARPRHDAAEQRCSWRILPVTPTVAFCRSSRATGLIGKDRRAGTCAFPPFPASLSFPSERQESQL